MKRSIKTMKIEGNRFDRHLTGKTDRGHKQDSLIKHLNIYYVPRAETTQRNTTKSQTIRKDTQLEQYNKFKKYLWHKRCYEKKKCITLPGDVRNTQELTLWPQLFPWAPVTYIQLLHLISISNLPWPKQSCWFPTIP